jgi:hypothetical protein
VGPVGPVGGGEGLGLSVGTGVGVFVGSGLGDSVGSALGDSVGDGDGVGLATGVGGPSEYPSVEGSRNSRTRRPASASVMKSCQMSAGIVPPNTAE